MNDLLIKTINCPLNVCVVRNRQSCNGADQPSHSRLLLFYQRPGWPTFYEQRNIPITPCQCRGLKLNRFQPIVVVINHSYNNHKGILGHSSVCRIEYCTSRTVGTKCRLSAFYDIHGKWNGLAVDSWMASESLSTFAAPSDPNNPWSRRPVGPDRRPGGKSRTCRPSIRRQRIAPPQSGTRLT